MFLWDIDPNWKVGKPADWYERELAKIPDDEISDDENQEWEYQEEYELDCINRARDMQQALK